MEKLLLELKELKEVEPLWIHPFKGYDNSFRRIWGDWNAQKIDLQYKIKNFNFFEYKHRKYFEGDFLARLNKKYFERMNNLPQITIPMPGLPQETSLFELPYLAQNTQPGSQEAPVNNFMSVEERHVRRSFINSVESDVKNNLTNIIVDTTEGATILGEGGEDLVTPELAPEEEMEETALDVTEEQTLKRKLEEEIPQNDPLSHVDQAHCVNDLRPDQLNELFILPYLTQNTQPESSYFTFVFKE